MRRIGIEELYRRRRTSIPARDAKIYPNSTVWRVAKIYYATDAAEPLAIAA
jgi:hypothetical protein